jgi:hypothetical protein
MLDKDASTNFSGTSHTCGQQAERSAVREANIDEVQNQRPGAIRDDYTNGLPVSLSRSDIQVTLKTEPGPPSAIFDVHSNSQFVETDYQLPRRKRRSWPLLRSGPVRR